MPPKKTQAEQNYDQVADELINGVVNDTYLSKVTKDRVANLKRTETPSNDGSDSHPASKQRKITTDGGILHTFVSPVKFFRTIQHGIKAILRETVKGAEKKYIAFQVIGQFFLLDPEEWERVAVNFFKLNNSGLGDVLGTARNVESFNNAMLDIKVWLADQFKELLQTGIETSHMSEATKNNLDIIVKKIQGLME